MSDNWVVQNLENALETWNEKLSEIWTLITTTPQNFKGGNIWKVIVDINGAVQAIGLDPFAKRKDRCDKCDGDGWDYVVTDRYSSKKEKRGSNDRK